MSRNPDQIIILSGGLGTRLREETEFIPKPMVKIGEKPIIWHIMKNLSNQGMKNFIISTGHKSELIKDYFVNYDSKNNDFTVALGQNKKSITYHTNHEENNWNVTISYTGELTNTGGRVKRSSKYLLPDRSFMVTYGDGLADINLQELKRFHQSHDKLATITTTRSVSRFGLLHLDEASLVLKFKEKPILESWINMGFFIFEPEVLDLIDLEYSLELEPLSKLAKMNQLMAFKHEGFWQPMDTYREFKLLNDLWEKRSAPWKNW